MDSDTKAELISTPKLPLFSIPLMPMMMSPEHPGMLTPPLQTSASVPCRWEEEPGKPRPCTDLIPLSNANSKNSDGAGPQKCLELPPKLLMVESKITKAPSPTTVLDGPRFFSSFRLRKEPELSQLFFESSCTSPDHRGQLRAMVLEKKKRRVGLGLFGSWSWRKKTQKIKGDGSAEKDAGGNSFVFASFMNDNNEYDDDANARVKMARIPSFSNHSTPKSLSHLCAIYERFKQVINWKSSRKSKKEGFVF